MARGNQNLFWKLGLVLLCLSLSNGALAESLVIKGSDTIGGLLVPQLANAYQRLHADVKFEISAEGSSTGILSVIEGDADIGMASRPLNDKELELAVRRGRNLVVVPFALDGIAVIVNVNNPIHDLSLLEVEMLFCGDIVNWSVLGPYEGLVYPYTRHTASGTYSRFQALALRMRDYSARSQKMAGNEQIAFEVSKNPYGIGYVSLMQRRAFGIKALKIDGILPDVEKILDGSYGLVRTLYLIYDDNRKKTAIDSFIDFGFSVEGREIIRSSQFLPIE